MKFEKIVLTVGITAFLLTAYHQALAEQIVQKKKNQAAAKTTKNSASKITTSRNQTMTKSTSKTKTSTLKKSAAKAPKKSRIETEIEQEARAYELAAMGTSIKNDALMAKNQNNSGQKTKGSPISTLKIQETAKEKESSGFSGGVSFTVGRDSNIDPDKTYINGSFYQIDPTLSFKSGNWSGSVSASIKDFSEQQQSNIFKQSEAKTEGSYTAQISQITTSTTSISGGYHDEMWPDYINGFSGTELNDPGMAIRYTDVMISQKLGFNFGFLQTDIGGSARHRDYLSKYSDFAPDILQERIYEKDYNELTAFSKVTLNVAEFLDLSLSPQISQQKYEERQGRQPHGQYGGEIVQAPAYELVTNQLALDASFKFAGSNVTPKAFIGQVVDEALGAENNSFYGFGLNSTLVLHKGTKLTLTPNAVYKKIAYDNWTHDGNGKFIANGEKRVDFETSAGVTASIMLAKNFGLNLGYSIVREKSNLTYDTSENYRQEIVSSALSFVF